MIHQHGTLNHKTQPVLYLRLQIKNEIRYYIPIAERSYAGLPYLRLCNSSISASSSTLQYVHFVACQRRKVVENGQSTCSFGTILGPLDPFGPFQAIIDF